jgi:hypothetical protein
LIVNTGGLMNFDFVAGFVLARVQS